MFAKTLRMRRSLKQSWIAYQKPLSRWAASPLINQVCYQTWHAGPFDCVSAVWDCLCDYLRFVSHIFACFDYKPVIWRVSPGSAKFAIDDTGRIVQKTGKSCFVQGAERVPDGRHVWYAVNRAICAQYCGVDQTAVVA